MTETNNSCNLEKFASVQQLHKKEEGQERKPIYPPTVIQAVFDAKTGAPLEAILAQYNNIYVQYQGSPEATRNVIPVIMRRQGLIISYVDMKGETIEEQCINATQKEDEKWGQDKNWLNLAEMRDEFTDIVYTSLDRIAKAVEYFLDNINQGITPEMLSESVKQMISKAGTVIHNAPDEEDITTTGGELPVLKFKDKEYFPENYSGMGRVYLRKNFVTGNRYTTQIRVTAPVTVDGTIAISLNGNPHAVPVTAAEHTTIDLVAQAIAAVPNANYDVSAEAEYVTFVSKTIGEVAATTIDNGATGTTFVISDTAVEDTINMLAQDMMQKENTIYIIQYDYDLNGEEITVPANCILQFEGGRLSNGTIVGNNSHILANMVTIFKDVVIKGKWLVEDIYFDWFVWDYSEGADNTNTLRSLFAFQNPTINNRIFIPDKTIYISVHPDNESYANDSIFAVAIIKSNTTLFFDGTLKLNTYNNSWYSIFYAHGENINIIGNGQILGDFVTHIPTGESSTDKTKDQYGFGIYYCGVKAGTIKGVTCNYCWGSGIRIDSNNDRNNTSITLGDPSQLSKNIHIVDVTCKFNRREGIIVEGALDTEISHCEISYTGYIDENKAEREFVDIVGTKYGIDIEPWQTHDANYRTYVHDCYIYNNKEGNISVNRLYQNKYARIERIYGLGKYWIAGDNVCISDVESNEVVLKYSHNTLIEKSKIRLVHFYGTDDVIVDTTIKDCDFNIDNFANNYYGGFLNHHTWQHTSVNTIVDSCTFTIGENVTVPFDLVKNGFVMKNGKVINCTINFPGVLGVAKNNLPPNIINCDIDVLYINIHARNSLINFTGNKIKARTEDSALGVFYLRYGNSAEDIFTDTHILDIKNNYIEKSKTLNFITFRTWQNFVQSVANITGNIMDGNNLSADVYNIFSKASKLDNPAVIYYGNWLRTIEKNPPGSMMFNYDTEKIYHTTGTAEKTASGETIYINMDGSLTTKVTLI